ncbi:MAG TPA: aldehyde dehydrogenase family protein, partial [Steroidobacteraceae bacterium]
MTSGQLYINGEWVAGAATFPVADKFSGEVLAQVAAATRDQVSQATAAAAAAFERQRLSPQTRYQILQRAAALLEAQRKLFTSTIVAESGFTISDADGEVNRGVQTFLACAEEAKRI